ncbi:hypothetical protein [Neisseria sp. CCUG12390]|uniref:hypothetical protein n=1 Tax=Neisseria sp. CCUG12390 TaxID=3392035 RepID=UPI003A0FC8FB
MAFLYRGRLKNVQTAYFTSNPPRIAQMPANGMRQTGKARGRLKRGLRAQTASRHTAAAAHAADDHAHWKL